MSDLPVWLTEILRQFPMVVVIGFVIWYAEKRVAAKETRLEERHDKQFQAILDREDRLRQEAREDRAAEIKRQQETQKTTTEANEKQLATRDEQIANLTKQLAALTKKLSG